ncbi:MAG TPA: HAD family hydrolase [Nitriliruptorales bacterium]|nr:HAD family hydrolase [Nitriliruptorales bacterium]
MATQPAVILDLDGTLVDSVYVHVICWDEAFRARGYEVPMWRIHAGIGMGGERLVPWLLGEHTDDVTEVSDDHIRRFLERADDLRPTTGAHALLHDLSVREVPFVVATSAGAEARKALLEALGRPDLDTTDAGQVPASKPAPHLLHEAAAQLGESAERATLVGDSPWDAEAARRIGVRTIAVRCGGFGDAELMRAGALDVVDHPGALVGRL